MDSNIEQILAPLRLAVKEQVTLNYLTISLDTALICVFNIRYSFMASDSLALCVAYQANRLLMKLCLLMNGEL